MMILSHRGYWLQPSEKNTDVAFKRSVGLNFGTETDIRDDRGRLVISHDMPSGSEMSISEFLDIFGGQPLPLALNIKADGLVAPLKAALAASAAIDAFVFDMAVPDMRAYLQADVPVFARMSEVEREPAWLNLAAGVWLDAFEKTWYDAPLVDSLLRVGKRVCVVSPELHGRDAAEVWKLLLPLAQHPGLMLCTDLPEQADRHFSER